LIQATSTGAVFFLSLYLTFRYLISVMLLFLVLGVIFFLLMDRFVATVDARALNVHEDYSSVHGAPIEEGSAPRVNINEERIRF
jgi:hypothetical protein